MLCFIRFYRSDFSTFPQAKTPPKQHQTTDSLTPVLSAPKPDPARDDGGHTGQPEGRAVVHPQEGAVHRLVDLSDLQQGDLLPPRPRLRHRRGQAVLRRAHQMRRRDGEQLLHAWCRCGGGGFFDFGTNLSLYLSLLTHLIP